MFQSLYHITHIDNVPGILARGLHCREALQRAQVRYVDLSEQSCQDRRRSRWVGKSCINLHEFVPMFLNPRNAMVYRLGARMKEQRSFLLAMLELDGSIAGWQHSLLADGIASSMHTRLFWSQDPNTVQVCDWQGLQSQTEPWQSNEEKRIRMAEVLVNQKLDPRYIRKVWVQRPPSLQRLAQRLNSQGLAVCAVDYHRKYFYHG